jgi:hypothetical protein
MIKREDIELVIKSFKQKSKPNDRYTSFDYCYNYFRSTPDLNKDIEKSCLVLGFYLASWGMFRGSSFLLQHSIKHFQPTIEYINTLGKSVWTIDVDNYTEENIQTIIKIYQEIKKRLILKGNTDLIITTKILLGVFGFIPAFDKYFCDSFRDIADKHCRFRKVDETSLKFIYSFYKENKQSIDHLSAETFTTDFLTGKETKINYPKAKIIDMYGFNLKQFVFVEKVFEILGEGGGITISRLRNKSGERFFYHHHEFDPTDEGLDVNKKNVYSNFEQAFQTINNKYSWYSLHLETVHEDFRDYVIEKLVEKLNEKSFPPKYLSQDDLEDTLQIKFNYVVGKRDDEFIWSYEKAI